MKKFWRKIISSRVFRGIPTSRPGFLEIEVIRVWWGTCYCHNCSVSQGRGRFSNLQFLPAVLVIFVPDFTQQTHCTWFLIMLHKNINSTFVELLHFLPDSSVFSTLEFLGNFLCSILDEDDSSILNSLHKYILSRWTYQSIEYLPTIVVLRFELTQWLK